MIQVILCVLLILIVVKTTFSEKIKCNDSINYQVSPNEIIFFESPNFPMSIDENVKERCQMIFTGNSTNNNMFLAFVITNGYITEGKVEISDNESLSIGQSNMYFFTYDPSISFYFNDSKIRNQEAFEGFVTFEEYREDSCFLAGRNESFKFSNESEIYYLRSHYSTSDDDKMVKRRCLWEFIAAPEFGVKLEILDLNFENGKLYVVTNKTRGYVRSPSITYYSDNFIAITYDGQNETFEAKVSIYNFTKKFDQNLCLFNIDKLIWESDPIISYGESIQCNKTFEILPNHELHVSIDAVLNENRNSLIFYSDSRMLFPVNFNQTGEFVFLPNADDTIRKLTFEFKSGENVINKKFKIKFKDVACKCGPKQRIISCTENQTFYVMEGNDDVYCANLTCSFEITINASCPGRFVKLDANIVNARYDNFSIKSGNDWLVYGINISSDIKPQKNYVALMVPNLTTIVHFQSAYDNKKEYLNVAKFALKTATYGKPKYLPDEVIVDESMKSYDSQIDPHSVITIRLSDDLVSEKAVLELLFDSAKLKKLKCISFYENRNLTSIKIINKDLAYVKLGTSITIYKFDGCLPDESLFVISARKPGENECLFKNTTVVNQRNKPLSMIAGPKKSCDFHIFNCGMSKVIKNIYTNSKTDDVILYSDANRRKELIRFNKATSKLYKFMTFNARIYSLRIPANASVYIEPTLNDPIFTSPTLSYYETPKYGAFNAARPDLTITYNLASYLEANFSVNDFNISSKGYLRIAYNGIVENITSMNEFFIANAKIDNTVKILFSDHKFGYRGALIYITVYDTRATSATKSTLFPTNTLISEPPKINSKACEINYKSFFIFINLFVFCLTDKICYK